jgi:hypothetical protein
MAAHGETPRLAPPAIPGASSYRRTLYPHSQSIFVSEAISGDRAPASECSRCRKALRLAALQFISIKKEYPMFEANLSRRNFAAAAATGLATLGLLGASATTASAYQGNMERALSSLNQAFESLRQATPNKGGHRERAMNLIQQAIDQVQEGIEFADRRD